MENEAIRFTKVKYNKGEMTLRYEKTSSQGNSECYMLQSTDQPLQGLLDALQALTEYVPIICEIETAAPIRILGVSFGYGGEPPVMGASISALLELESSHSPLTLNTPYKASDTYCETGDDSVCLGVECVTVLNRLCDEAEKYLQGERAQGELFVADIDPGVKVA